jgi:hypothetical protein
MGAALMAAASPIPLYRSSDELRERLGRLSQPMRSGIDDRRFPDPSRTADTIATEKTLGQRLGLRVRLRLNSHDGGSIMIRFETQAQLDHVAGLLLGGAQVAAAAAA